MLRCSQPVCVAPSPTGLAFDVVGGPLVAIVGLCGGAGVSTLTHLVAAAAARESSAPVLAMDTGGSTGGLAAYAGVASDDSLVDVARALDRDAPLHGPLFAVADCGARVLATGPRFAGAVSEQAVQRILGDARSAHGLTVVDCGSLTRDADLLALRAATHVAWVLPATASGVARAQRVLAELDVAVEGREVLVARHDACGRRAPLSELGELAVSRRACLALLAHVADHDERTLDDRLQQASVTLAALAPVLQEHAT